MALEQYEDVKVPIRHGQKLTLKGIIQIRDSRVKITKQKWYEWLDYPKGPSNVIPGADQITYTLTATKEHPTAIYSFAVETTEPTGKWWQYGTYWAELIVKYPPECTGISILNNSTKAESSGKAFAMPGDIVTFGLENYVVGAPDDTTYSWQQSTDGKTWTTISGATSSTFKMSVGNVPKFRIRCVLGNGEYKTDGFVSPEAAVELYTQPTVSKAPQSQTVLVGSQVTFGIGVTHGNPSDTVYGWHYKSPGADSWKAIPGATSSSYSFTATIERNGYQYCCMVGNSKFPIGKPENYGEAALLTVFSKLKAPTDLKTRDIVSVSDTLISWKRPPDATANSVVGFAIFYSIQKTGSSTISEIKPLVKSGAVENHTVDLTTLGLDFGDVISFYIQAVGSQSPDGDSDVVQFPATLMFGGILHVRRGGEWLPVIPYIKIAGEWKIAISYVKYGGAWKMTG